MIEVEHLTKRYGDKFAVNDLTFSVNEGEIVGFLGPNGAGKSTTMNIITGYLSSNEGKVRVAGYDVLENPNEAKRHIGYLPEMPPLYIDMTVREYLNFMYNLKRVKYNRRAHIEEICRLVRIEEVYTRLIRNLSKGYRQRVGLAQALLGNPDVLILDEPTVGLDPKQIIEIRSLIKSLGKKHTVILSTHILPEVQSVCERILIINHGRIVADDTEQNLSSSLSTQSRLGARIAGPADHVARALKSLAGVVSVTTVGTREAGSTDFAVECKPGTDVRRPLFGLLARQNWPLLSLTNGELTLEDIFLRLTADDISAEQLLGKVPKTETGADASSEAGDADSSAEKPAEQPAEESKEKTAVQEAALKAVDAAKGTSSGEEPEDGPAAAAETSADDKKEEE